MKAGDCYTTAEKTQFQLVALAFFLEMQKADKFAYAKMEENMDAALERAEVFMGAVREEFNADLAGEEDDESQKVGTHDDDARHTLQERYTAFDAIEKGGQQ